MLFAEFCERLDGMGLEAQIFRRGDAAGDEERENVLWLEYPDIYELPDDALVVGVAPSKHPHHWIVYTPDTSLDGHGWEELWETFEDLEAPDAA